MDEPERVIIPERREGVMPLEDLKARMRCVVETKDCMIVGVHYGKIPGIAKPSLWEPGAELLCQRFQLYPKYEVSIDDIGNDHVRARAKCMLFHIATGRQEGEDVAVCTTKEKKYRYVQSERTCPQCGTAAIIKGRAEYGGGYVCLLPDTPVLYADHTWRAIGKAKPGDIVLGFDEYPLGHKHGRKFRPSTIEAVWSSRQPTRRLITNNAEIITTAKHRWIQHHTKPGHIGRWGDPWVETDHLQIGNSLRFIGTHQPPEITSDYRAGYLVGMTFSDGTYRYLPNQKDIASYWRVALKTSDEVALERIVAYLSTFGIDAYIRPFDSGVTKDGLPYPMKKVELRSQGRLEAFHWIMAHEETLEFQRGFLAGFFDADGSGSDGRLSIYGQDPVRRSRLVRYATNLGFTLREYKANDIYRGVRLVGGVSEAMRFVATMQPALMRKAGVNGVTMQYDPCKILGIEPGPTMDVIDIQTSTGTFFASGIATHNCFQKKDGCGAKFKDGDKSIEGQSVGQIENPDLADKWNTIVQMAQKRAYVKSTLVATAASEFFTQDDDSDQRQPEATEAKPEAKPNAHVDDRPLRTQPKPEEVPDNIAERTTTKGHREIIALSQRRVKISDAHLLAYLKDRYQVESLEALPQKYLTQVLGWLDSHIGGPASSEPQAQQPKPELRQITGAILSVAVGAKTTQVRVKQTGGKEYSLFFRQEKPPLGMPAMQVGGHWSYLQGKLCVAQCEPVKNDSGATVLMLREIKVELPLSPQESKQRFEDMKSKYDTRSKLLDENQKASIWREVDKSSVAKQDFEAFLLAVHQHNIDTLPAAKYAEVIRHLESGYVGTWCIEQTVDAHAQQAATA